MKRIQKPIRLYVLVVFIVVAYGFMPFVSTFPVFGGFLLLGLWNLPLNGSIVVLYGPDDGAPFLLVLVSLFLCVFSTAAAIWAFYGEAWARTATLILITFDVAWWSALVLTALVENGLRDVSSLQLGFELLPPVGWLIFIWWNFMQPDITEYYKYRSTLQE